MAGRTGPESQHDVFQSPTALGGVPPRDPASHLTRRRHSTSLVSLTNQVFVSLPALSPVHPLSAGYSYIKFLSFIFFF